MERKVGQDGPGSQQQGRKQETSQSLEGCLVAWNPRNVSNLPTPIVRVQFYHL